MSPFPHTPDSRCPLIDPLPVSLIGDRPHPPLCVRFRSDPFTDLEDGLDNVEGNTGVRPNKLVMGAIVWRRLKPLRDDDAARGSLSSSTFSAARMLWYFVVGVWPVLYLSLYL